MSRAIAAAKPSIESVVAAGHQPQILIEHRRADRGRVKEAEGLAEAEDLLQRLGQGGEVHRGAVRAGVAEGVLLGDDRLAGAWQPHDDADAVGGQAAAQNLVEWLVPAAQAAVSQQMLLPGPGPGPGRRWTGAGP